MNEFETSFTDMYRCIIEPTGETYQRLQTFKLPMDPHETFQYSTEREIAIRMPEPEIRQFLNDFENFVKILSVMREHPHLESEYQKLLVLVNLLSEG